VLIALVGQISIWKIVSPNVPTDAGLQSTFYRQSEKIIGPIKATGLTQYTRILEPHSCERLELGSIHGSSARI
jgi:hypothetical protein